MTNKFKLYSELFYVSDGSYKSLIQIQNAAFKLACSRIRVSLELRKNLIDMLKVTLEAGQMEKSNELLGQILFITQKLVRYLEIFLL